MCLTIEGKDEPRLFINNEFIFKYYSGDNNNADSYKKLSNKSHVVVVVPNIVDHTTKFCDGILSFLNIIEKNEVYREILNDKTTRRDYFITDIYD